MYDQELKQRHTSDRNYKAGSLSAPRRMPPSYTLLAQTRPRLTRMREAIRLSMLRERLERLHALMQRYLESA